MKQFFSYFKILFLVLGVLLVITLVMGVARLGADGNERHNDQAPKERVYDYADVLSDEEEDNLRELIARRENQIGCDIVLVVTNESVLERYGYTENTDRNWASAMERYADDFYDENKYGYNRVHGDGALLLDNWYEGEKGTHLCTTGSVFDYYGNSDIDDLLDDVYDVIDYSPYLAYSAYVEHIYYSMMRAQGSIRLSVLPLLLIAVVSAGVFVVMHLKSKEGEKTTVASTYVEKGSARFHVQRDDLINTYVTTRVIPKSTGGGGGGGGHRSSGGVRHGGGSRRR